MQADLFIHQAEKSEAGTAYVQENEPRLTEGCKKVLRWLQTHQNIPITNKIGRDLKISSYTSARVSDLRKNGIVIITNWVYEDGNKVASFKLGCQCLEPNNDVAGCYLHDEKLKV